MYIFFIFMYNIFVQIIRGDTNMVDLLYESIYKKEKGYKFIDQLFYNNNKKLVYCFIAVKNKKTECLLQWYNGFTNSEKDKVIKDYLAFKSIEIRG